MGKFKKIGKFTKIAQNQERHKGQIQIIVDQAIAAHNKTHNGWQVLNNLIAQLYQKEPTLDARYTNIIKQEFMQQTGHYRG